MYTETIQQVRQRGVCIQPGFERSDKLGFWLSSAMAGACNGPRHHPHLHPGQSGGSAIRPLVMGATFGIALTLVIIAGSEPFTSHTMFLTFRGEGRARSPWPTCCASCRRPGRQSDWLHRGGAHLLPHGGSLLPTQAILAQGGRWLGPRHLP